MSLIAPPPSKALFPQRRRQVVLASISLDLVRTPDRFPEGPLVLDGLDGFILACAQDEITVRGLVARLPCSPRASLRRIERLIAAGALDRRTRELGCEAADERLSDAEERETVRPHASNPPG